MSAPVQNPLMVETSPVMALEARTPRTLAMDNAAQNIGELLRFAIERNVPVEALEKLVALHERISERDAAREFAAAMAAFQAECPPIKHSRTADITTNAGASFKYTYAELDEIARVVNPILAKHGLSYSWDSKVEKDVLDCVCTVRHINGHSVSSKFSLPIENKSAMSPQQKVGAALTFAQRRSLSAVLGLTTTDTDTDARDADTTRLGEDAATEIDDMITEYGVDRAKLLKYLGAARVADIRAADYEKAKKAIRTNAAKRKQESAR